MPRLARDIVTIPGVGGHLMIKRSLGRDDTGALIEDPTDLGKAYENAVYLEISRYWVRHQYIRALITHSGSNGAIKRALVAQDWEFAAELPWNAREIATRDSEAVGFIENILLGNRAADWNVSILFNLGDPLHYPDSTLGSGLDRRGGLHGSEVALELSEVVCDSTGADVIQINVTGKGNSLLRGIRGTEVMFNNLTDPADPPPPAGL